MHNVANTMKETQLRANISSVRQTVDDYLELASILFEAKRFEESLAILRQGLTAPFGSVARAILLTALGSYARQIRPSCPDLFYNRDVLPIGCRPTGP
jgi:hypothetical protein